jgi:cob(I)alamin adenosyltransferase
MTKIYTRTGDTGETGLIDGSRVPKDHVRVAACGEVDELNASLGVARAHAQPELAALIDTVQRDLFSVGAQLGDPTARVGASKTKAAMSPEHVRRLEEAIDVRQAQLPPLRTFLLPGGSPLGSLLHLARTVCRRAERSVVTLARSEEVDPSVEAYLNRLSDLLFVLARDENLSRNQPEHPW